MSVPTVAPSPTKPPRKAYVPAVGPRLRIVLYIVFGLVAALGANSLYLSAITFMDWWHGPGQTYQNYFYLYMFLAHLGLGLLLVIPYCLFGAVHLLAARKRRNRTAVRIGYALFIAGIGVLVTGVLLMRVGDLQLKHPLRGRPFIGPILHCRWRRAGCIGCIGWPGRGSSGESESALPR